MQGNLSLNPTNPRSTIQLIYLFTLDHSSTGNIVLITIHVRADVLYSCSIPNIAGTMVFCSLFYVGRKGDPEIHDVILGGAVSAFSFSLMIL